MSTMDIRGIEVTNQLRSAIRAKLLELGVRYDEELPDYILVMVVNKKSRQQMHEDLYLFLEDSTTPFVDWLHDQVLKKLQKVTIAKKKTSREFVPTVVVKQEEERKKKRTTTSFLEDHATEQSTDKVPNKLIKEDKLPQKQNTKATISQNAETSQNKNIDRCSRTSNLENRLEDTPSQTSQEESPVRRTYQQNVQSSNIHREDTTPDTTNKSTESRRASSDTSSRNLKRSLDATEHDNSEKKNSETKKAKVSEKAEDSSEDTSKKLKSCVNKPKITSVVSVKNRLGIVSPRKKFEIYREKSENEGRYRQSDKRFERHRYDTNRNNNFQRGRSFEVDDRLKKSKTSDLRSQEQDKNNDIKSRLGMNKAERLNKNSDTRDKLNANSKAKINEKSAMTIKDRLGLTNNIKLQKQSTIKTQEIEYKNAKCLEQDREISTNNKNIKTRLGPLKNNFKPIHSKANFIASSKHSQSSEDEDCLNLGTEDRLDEDTESVVNSNLKSHIIAVKKPPIKIERKQSKSTERGNQAGSNNADEEIEESKLPSKVIVTPRPLKPLQPTQKRATQSLLLRAVAEANQSVVTQKNPEPSLVDKKPALKRLRPPVSREVGQNLSVHFNANKRLVMENIKVEFNTVATPRPEPRPYVIKDITDERMGVVMSLFQRSDDNQKFLVTFNGYNNNHSKEKTTSDDEERLEMEVNEDDELALLNTQNDVYTQNESETNVFRITDTEDDTDLTGKDRSEENNENCNTENVDAADDVPRKKRKLSPIVYNRSPTSSPIELKTNLLTSTPLLPKQKRNPVDPLASTVTDKTKEKCRYWPNCTLGNKCAFLHPAVMCSAFPACKFGDKCAYKHPKCKFGLSCTKLGCVFSHPVQQCKYHPFCTKPACPYTHPAAPSTLSVEATTQRAKFTWRRRD